MFRYEIRFTLPGSCAMEFATATAANAWEAVAQIRARFGDGIKVFETCCVG